MTNRNAARRCVLCFVTLLSVSISVTGEDSKVNSSQEWMFELSADDSIPTPRHETSAVVVEDQLYLIGGRGLKAVERYDPATKVWTQLSNTPFEIHHFQPVYTAGKVYVLGAFTCCYPDEPSVPDIQLYDPATDTWTVGSAIPLERQRGGAAAAVHDDKIYLLGGNTLGHNGGAVPWFDEYDPVTGTWTVLPDAPNARDHFSAVLVNGQLVATGGRTTTLPDPFANTVAPVDVYDFESGTWVTGADPLPTERAGAMAVGVGGEVILIGGEVTGVPNALDTVEAFDVATGEWRNLQALQQQRHSGAAVVIDGNIHVVVGGIKQGGGQETATHETLEIEPVIPPPLDTDVDGLTDDDETNLYGTDPEKADTDDDGLTDGNEIELGTRPTVGDTDEDGVNDGDEVNLWESDPLDADTDNDRLTDGDEVLVHNTHVRRRDTDGDGINDGDEIEQGLNPLSADTDDDGLDDNVELTQSNTDPSVADTDSDLLTDADEFNVHNTDPNSRDSDSDGVEDGVEIGLSSDPLSADTDEDGLSDGEEVNDYDTSPVKTDTDGDGLSDGDEVNTHNTRPDNADTDSDGLDDGLEIQEGYDPLKADTDDDGQSDSDAYTAAQAAADLGRNPDTDLETGEGNGEESGGGGSMGGSALLLGALMLLTRRRKALSIR